MRLAEDAHHTNPEDDGDDRKVMSWVAAMPGG